MKKLLALLICCLLIAPVSADYWMFKDVSADDFVNALVAYSNHNEVHNMTESEFELSNHNFRSFNVTRTLTTLDFDYKCEGAYVVFFPLPLFVFPCPYIFTGHMHVVYPEWGLGNLYELSVYDSDQNFTACGSNWVLTGKDCGGSTRFYVNEDEPNRLETRATWMGFETTSLTG